MRHLLIAVFATILLALPAHAGEQDFRLVNKTGSQIDEVYVSRTAARSWGPDVMGRGTLDEDASVDIGFTAPPNACRWDLKVKYNDGDEAEWSDLNLCSVTTVTLYWDRKKQTTRAVTD